MNPPLDSGKQRLLRLQFVANRTIPEPIMLEEIHDELRALCDQTSEVKIMSTPGIELSTRILL